MSGDTKRMDDIFLRRVIWLVLSVAITSTAGWIWTLSSIQSQLDENTKKIEKLEENRDLLIEIKGIVNRTSSDISELKTNQAVFGKEQSKRTRTIIDSNAHMKNRRIHK